MLSPDIVDGLMRRLNQLDVSIDFGNVSTRWRHFLESDFAMRAIGGFDAELSFSVWNQFANVGHQVALTHTIIVPVVVTDIWTVYMYDMNKTVVYVLDLAYDKERLQLHVQIHEILHATLTRCTEKYFDVWTIKSCNQWQVAYTRLSNDTFTSEDSAIAMIHYARHFNGDFLEAPFEKDDLISARRALLVELLSLEGNEVDLPDMVSKIVQ